MVPPDTAPKRSADATIPATLFPFAIFYLLAKPSPFSFHDLSLYFLSTILGRLHRILCLEYFFSLHTFLARKLFLLTRDRIKKKCGKKMEKE
jgi:hypothetical protein